MLVVKRVRTLRKKEKSWEKKSLIRSWIRSEGSVSGIVVGVFGVPGGHGFSSCLGCVFGERNRGRFDCREVN